MHHTSARRVIGWLLEGSGIGHRGLALSAAAGLGDASVEAVQLRELALTSSAALACHVVPPCHAPLNNTPLPINERQLCQQICPEIIARPANVGLKIASLSAFVRLWSHVSADERARLRSTLIDTLTAIEAPPASQLSAEQLREWQRSLPTMLGDVDSNKLADLRSIIDHTDPQLVYRALSERLMSGADLGMLFRVVSSLAIRVRLSRRDQQCRLHHVILGAIAGEELVKHAPPDQMATILAQLVHQIWWCRHHANLEPLPASGTDPGLRYAQAVTSGDALLACRAARAASKNPEQFWHDSWEIMESMLTTRRAGWPEALTTLVAMAWRTGHNMVAPDDAGLLGMVFCDPICQGAQTIAG